MSEFQNKRRGNFTIISNGVLLNPALSLRAKGLLSLMLSRPDGWVYRMDWIIKQSKEGRDSTTSAIKELIAASYVIRRAKRDLETGQLQGWTHIVSDEPMISEDPTPEKPTDGEPEGRVTRPTAFQGDSSNKESINTDFKKTENQQPPGSVSVWKLWVAHCDLKGPSLEANQQEWNEWMKLGLGEELETQAREVIKLGKGDGGYKFPVAGLSSRMKGKINVQHAKLEQRVSEECSAAAVLERQSIVLGSRWEHPSTRQALQVAEISGTTVFFEDGGPIDEIWLSHMAGWKQLGGAA